jgi:signal transduction histidine kinase
VERANALLFAEPQVVIAWDAQSDQPEILGDPGILNSVPIARRVLAFGSWLDVDQAKAMETAVEALRSRGQGFSRALTTLTGRQIEADGRAVVGRAVLRLKEVSGVRRELNELTVEYDKLLREVDALRTLVEALPSPMWATDGGGRTTWVNPAYAHAVEARDAGDAVARGLELLDSIARSDLAIARTSGEPYASRLAVIVAGTRRIFDVFDLATRHGRAGIGIDVTEVETTRAELARAIDAHRRTLDQLPTAVAIFGADHRLTFHNAAYRALWGLAAEFLDQRPTDGAILDQLRAARRLPEQADFRTWKNQLHAAYRAVEPTEHLWHLPDGRTLRVVTTPDPEGGITYLFDDVTEALELKRRFDALFRVQGETLDHLSEAVAVFGSDGRLRLSNPVFARMWRLPHSALADRPHVETIITACQALHEDESAWQSLREAVTGLEQRHPFTTRLERKDGSVIDCATMPLPDGATLVTFQDVTDTVNVERALRERNDALQAAYDLKNDFVHLISYELRSPLTNIIGFAQLLEDPGTGPLVEKQREYLGYINASSASLLAIINDILDLATIDAGVMKLDLSPVDIRATVESVAEAVRDRLAEHDLELEIRADAQVGSFVADERRLRQILYNLLINAIGFSPAGEIVTLAVERRRDAVLFRVSDRGPGIPTEIQDRVFDRFETHALGSRHRGTGLGLSIVRSFVELHGGTVKLDSAVGRGTTVLCAFPVEYVAEQAAAAE